MKELLGCFLFAITISMGASADGVVTIAPAEDPVARWEYVSLRFMPSAAPPSATLTVVWLTQAGRDAQLDTALYPRDIVLNGNELVAFINAVSPAGTDAFSGTAGPAKRFRQRASKWLIDNGKMSRGGNE